MGTLEISTRRSERMSSVAGLQCFFSSSSSSSSSPTCPSCSRRCSTRASSTWPPPPSWSSPCCRARCSGGAGCPRQCFSAATRRVSRPEAGPGSGHAGGEGGGQGGDEEERGGIQTSWRRFTTAQDFQVNYHAKSYFKEVYVVMFQPRNTF